VPNELTLSTLFIECLLSPFCIAKRGVVGPVMSISSTSVVFFVLGSAKLKFLKAPPLGRRAGIEALLYAVVRERENQGKSVRMRLLVVGAQAVMMCTAGSTMEMPTPMSQVRSVFVGAKR
jgi:hypothetical protein